MPLFTPLFAALFAVIILATTPQMAQADCSHNDLNNDGVVNVLDVLIVLESWGECANPANCPADLNGDGIVNVLDMLIMLETWGPVDPVSGVFPDRWISGGPACGFEPVIQVHQYNDNFYILRQSLCTNFEAPFIYLLFGEDKVLMQDTGAGGIPIANTVYDIIDDWLDANNKDSITLVVSHSHGHGDHVQGNSQFVGQPNTVMTGTSQTAVKNFFGIDDWPNDIVEYDLGGRIIDVIPIPGHQAAHIALYDRETGILFTGDTLYPGRLYISNFSQYVESIGRMIDFIEDQPVCWVFGTHIEMTNEPGVDYPFGATHHPNEHPLQLTVDHLHELHQAVLDMNGVPVYQVHDSFIIFPLGGAAAVGGDGDEQAGNGAACCMRPQSVFDIRRAMRIRDEAIQAAAGQSD